MKLCSLECKYDLFKYWRTIGWIPELIGEGFAFSKKRKENFSFEI